MQEQFTDEEWFLLATTPSLVGAAMAGAGRSGGLGTAKEALKSVTAVAQGQADYPNSQLIAKLLSRGGHESEAGDASLRSHQRLTGRLQARHIESSEQIRALALEDVDRVRELLDRLPVDESAAYRSWVLGIAQKVAEAAKEGSFFGFGGERVSEEEEKLLHELRGKLG
ncbi:MAG: hypothetical protein AAGA81_04880 [Acidobacteriota bacterium]